MSKVGSAVKFTGKDAKDNNSSAEKLVSQNTNNSLKSANFRDSGALTSRESKNIEVNET